MVEAVMIGLTIGFMIVVAWFIGAIAKTVLEITENGESPPAARSVTRPSPSNRAVASETPFKETVEDNGDDEADPGPGSSVGASGASSGGGYGHDGEAGGGIGGDGF